MLPKDKVAVLLQWCASNSVFIDEKIQLQEDVQSVGIAVYSLESYIPPNTTLVRISKDAILSVRTCSLAKNIPIVSYGLGAQLSLSLALYVEMLKHDQSKWHGYLQSLPDDIIDLPMFWMEPARQTNSSDAVDCEEALLWLNGTEAAKILHSRTESNQSILDEIHSFFLRVAEPLLHNHHASAWTNSDIIQAPTITGFYRAFSYVSSRAFLVDTYHGLSMVPIADAFNHTVDHHVHLESDYIVCPECGSLQECHHDGDKPRPKTEPQLAGGAQEYDSFYEMVSNTGIPPNSEIFNTYGEKLTNAELLNQYGFLLDVNENDRLVWSVQDVLEVCFHDKTAECRVGTLEIRNTVLDTLLQHPNFHEQSELVYSESAAGDCLCLNDEGKISAQLWSLLLAASFQRTSRSKNLLVAILDFQLSMESEVECSDQQLEMDSATSQVLFQLAQSVIDLCERRKLNSGKSGTNNSDLLELLEKIPQFRRRTRLAISALLSERSILDACRAGWLTLCDNIQIALNSHPTLHPRS